MTTRHRANGLLFQDCRFEKKKADELRILVEKKAATDRVGIPPDLI
jgi:hypothetical protein